MSETSQAVAESLVEACRSLDIEELHGIDETHFAVGVDADLVIEIEHDRAAGKLTFIAELGAPLAGEETAAYKLLLQANALWRTTGGLRFSLNAAREADEGEAVLSQEFPLAGATADGLRQGLQIFFEAARAWRGLLAARKAAPGPELGLSEVILRI